MIILREFQEKDVNDVTEIELLSFKQPFSHLPLIKLSMMYKYGFIVAENKRKVVGYIAGTPQDKEVFHILSFAVHPLYRGQGIGSMLLAEIINRARKAVFKSVLLEVRVSNTKARKLYERFGFKIVKRKERYYMDGEDAYIMIKMLV